eukprot:TRINITY_DN6804_c0_g1_i1.p1 TRINITY_DN6804_c0_g1~~TRINITY_DN6804_c0_g1_i1.p1  ORF type:complete len:272 (+),score=33.62 TRINITY_DN6804_c0_g1_i1:212-1027(+)
MDSLESPAGKSTGPDTKRKAKIEERETLEYPENKAPTYNFLNSHWNMPVSSLSSSACWKCGKKGHLSDDCTGFSHAQEPGVTIFGDKRTNIDEQAAKAYTDKKGNATIYSPNLRKMYNRCVAITKNKSKYSCSACGQKKRLVFCLDCNLAFCDDGHMATHLRDFPSHNTLYSFKLSRQIKCCKSTCETSNIYKLMGCQHCFESHYDKYYDKLALCWLDKGLQFMPNAVCCKKHFKWHLINCPRAVKDEELVDKSKMEHGRYDGKRISDFLF